MVATDEYRAPARRAARRLRVAFAARVFAGIALAVVAFASLLVASAADAKRIVYCTRHHHPRGCVAIPRVARQPARRSQQGPDSLTPSNVVNGGGLGGGPGDHRAAALSWARSQQRLTRWAWRCERFVEEAYGTRGKFDTAGQAVAKLALHRGPVTEAPPGSLVYFAANQANRGFGHVGLSLGHGRIISALARVTITDVAHSRYWSTLYLGWADAPASWPGRIPPPPGPTIEDPGLNVRVTAPAFGSMLSGSVPIAATATDASGVRFFAYYAARQVDPATRAWHLIGDGRAADGGWITDWDTTAIPDQGNPLWGTVNVAAVAIGDDGKLTATRDYRRVSVSNTLGPGLTPTLGIGFPPRGALIATTRASSGSAQVYGWARDPDDLAAAVSVTALVDGEPAARSLANGATADQGAHGFSFTVPTDERRHSVCILAANVGPGSDAQIGDCGVIRRFGDLNADDAINCDDVAILQAAYGGTGGPADLNGDGTVNIFDLSILLSHVDAGTGPCP